MNALDKQHLDLLLALEGFEEATLDSYFEVQPDGQFEKEQYLDVEPAPQYMGE